MAKTGGTVEVAINQDQFDLKGEAQSGVETAPATYEVEIQGVSAILFHRWDVAAIEAKGKAKKNSAEKKTDNVESYCYRCENGDLGLPAENLHMALAWAGKSKADPRSPRKSAHELVKAVLLITPEVISFGQTKWDYQDMRRVQIQRQGVTRTRPALRSGWTLKFHITVLESSYVDEIFLKELIDAAGRFVGVCDHRPQFGRFSVIKFGRLF